MYNIHPNKTTCNSCGGRTMYYPPIPPAYYVRSADPHRVLCTIRRHLQTMYRPLRIIYNPQTPQRTMYDPQTSPRRTMHYLPTPTRTMYVPPTSPRTMHDPPIPPCTM